MSEFSKGQQVEIYSGGNVLDATGSPFWYPAVVTSGPFETNRGERGYYVLGVGEAHYPFDQYCKRAADMRPAVSHRRDLCARYEAFRQWATGS